MKKASIWCLQAMFMATSPWFMDMAHAGVVCQHVSQNICVIDGDTIAISDERIRIANIDTPEISSPKCDAERRLGIVAKKRLAELLSSGPIHINRGDPASGRMTDKYRRTLATISVNGKDVGDILVNELLARPWSGKRRNWCD